MKTVKGILVSIFVLPMVLTPGYCVRAAEPKIIIKMLPSMSLGDANARVALARIDRVTDRSTNDLEIYAYEATALFEYRGSLKEGSAFQFDGISSRGGGAGLGSFPHLQVGHIYLLAGRAGTDAGKLTILQGGYPLPIGLWPLNPVKAQDIPLVKASLAKLGEIAQTKEMTVSKDEAQKLFQTRDNYFLWALGATALAGYGDEASVGMLKGACNGGNTTVRQMVWLDRCFGEILNEQTRPSFADRYGMLLYYLQRLSATDSDKAAPPPATQERDLDR